MASKASIPPASTPNPSTLPIHPFCAIFPVIDKDSAAYKEFKADIVLNGQLEAVWTWRDASGTVWLLDGKNRQDACTELGIPLRTRDYATHTGDTAGVGLLAFTVALNMHRRQMTPSQRAYAAAEIANMRQGARTDLQPKPNLAEVSIADAAKAMGASTGATKAVKAIIANAIPEIALAVKDGKVTVHAATEIAKHSPAVQRDAAAKLQKGARPADVMAELPKPSIPVPAPAPVPSADDYDPFPPLTDDEAYELDTLRAQINKTDDVKERIAELEERVELNDDVRNARIADEIDELRDELNPPAKPKPTKVTPAGKPSFLADAKPLLDLPDPKPAKPKLGAKESKVVPMPAPKNSDEAEACVQLGEFLFGNGFKASLRTQTEYGRVSEKICRGLELVRKHGGAVTGYVQGRNDKKLKLEILCECTRAQADLIRGELDAITIEARDNKGKPKSKARVN